MIDHCNFMIASHNIETHALTIFFQKKYFSLGKYLIEGAS